MKKYDVNGMPYWDGPSIVDSLMNRIRNRDAIMFGGGFYGFDIPKPPAVQPELALIPLAEAVELLNKHRSDSWQNMLDRLEKVGVVLARRVQ